MTVEQVGGTRGARRCRHPTQRRCGGGCPVLASPSAPRPQRCHEGVNPSHHRRVARRHVTQYSPSSGTDGIQPNAALGESRIVLTDYTPAYITNLCVTSLGCRPGRLGSGHL